MIFRIILMFSLNINFVFAQDLSTEMNDFLDGIGFDANVTEEHRYKGQSAGYYTGGSIYARNRVINTPVANVQFPSVSAGCGGIDMYAGGFSFINEDQFVALMKGIASNAVGFAFQLAMDTISPSISSNLKNLRSAVNKMNNFNINSCNAAKAAVGSGAGLLGLETESYCKLAGNVKGRFSDYASSAHGCRADGEQDTAISGATQAEKNAGVGPKNLTWQILKRDSSTDDSYNQLAMSLIGTFISRKDGSSFTTVYKPPTILSDETRKALLYGGGNVTLYECVDVEDCLEVTDVEKTLTVNFRQKVSEKIESIRDKIKAEALGEEGQVFTAQEKAFIQNAPLPIYKIINVQLSYEKASAVFSLDELVDYMSVLMLYDFLEKFIVEAQIKYKAHDGLNKDNREKYKEHIKDLKDFINSEKSRVSSQLDDLSRVVERIELIENKVKNDLGKRLLNMSGGGGL